MATVENDLYVETLSQALHGRRLDLVVSGSIGAVESVRFARALRRLGADVQGYITQGGLQFVTTTALSWATAKPVRTEFEGTASHLASGDACIVAPASADFIGKIAQGITDSPGAALVASYLGQKKPVIIVPNMHDSLAHSPFIAANITRLRQFSSVVSPRLEEGKHKFPDPSHLADQVAHLLRSSAGSPSILITMGSTRGYIDSVRYISNYSSGALGTAITEELYRLGFHVRVISGPCQITPKSYSELQLVETYEEMAEAVQSIAKQPLAGAVFAASVLDFVPERRLEGKVRSSEQLAISFKKTEKIIAMVNSPLKFKVGFKLEDSQEGEAIALAKTYLTRYELSHIILNQRSEVSAHTHKALLLRAENSDALKLNSKQDIARTLGDEALRIFQQDIAVARQIL